MIDKHITPVRGMNGSKYCTLPGTGKMKGVITDGVSEKAGYKVVSPQGRSPQAVPQNTGKGRGT